METRKSHAGGLIILAVIGLFLFAPLPRSRQYAPRIQSINNIVKPFFLTK